ncbi:MAG: hypothetical protein QOI53_4221 [Verrucomicrobiota bacterium]|nr:hypothetical protein [Verrucomicrobiota bacterium]
MEAKASPVRVPEGYLTVARRFYRRVRDHMGLRPGRQNTRGVPRRGYRTQPQGFNPGNPSKVVHPHKALPSSALLEKHPVRRVGGAEGVTGYEMTDKFRIQMLRKEHKTSQNLAHLSPAA